MSGPLASAEVVVIGGGPAGMMAAGTAAARGKSVILIEKNHILGKKLLITGGGRCNILNHKPSNRALLARYTGSARYLFSSFSQFGIEETLDFFHRENVPTFEEAEGRVFPVTENAQSVRDALSLRMKKYGVRVLLDTAVSKITYHAAHKYFLVAIGSAGVLRCRSCIIATGGVSRPDTGSTGDGFRWLRDLGHTLKEPDYALVPISLKDAWAKKISGLALDSIKVSLVQFGRVQTSARGKFLFTHFGASGPVVLNMSRDIGEMLKYAPVSIYLDLFPDQDHGELKKVLQSLLVTESNKKIKNSLARLIPSGLVSPLLLLSRINLETPNHSVRSEQRAALTAALKAIPLTVKGLLGADKAVVSSGGVVLDEVHGKTLESRLIPGLFLVGDILNINRPSGGYSLQLCWTTGYVAGSSC